MAYARFAVEAGPPILPLPGAPEPQGAGRVRTCPDNQGENAIVMVVGRSMSDPCYIACADLARCRYAHMFTIGECEKEKAVVRKKDCDC